MRAIASDDQFILRLRMRVEDAMRERRDVAGAALDAIREHEAARVPIVTRLLGEARRVEIHRGTETLYRIMIANAEAEGVIELTGEDLAANHVVFVEKYLTAFDEVLTFPKGTWVEFVNGLLRLDTVVRLEGREDVDEEEIAVEAFIERVKRWKVTSDLHRSIREEDMMYWEPETGCLLLRSERVNRFLKSGAHKVTLRRFGYLLRNRGIVRHTSFQRWVPAKEDEEKGMALHFWRLDAPALRFTAKDIMSEPSPDLPPDPMATASSQEGAQL